MRLILATLLAISLLPATAAAQDAGVVTGPAQPVGQTTATLTGSGRSERNGQDLVLRVRHDDGLRAQDGRRVDGRR